jgi:hypothetical protein
LATIIHRRTARATGPEPARGPGARLDALTWIGWASAVAAFGFLVFGLRPLAEMGDVRSWNLGQAWELVRASLRDASIVFLPAALELGVPGARRRTPWLMRGTVLLALEQLAGPVLDWARNQYVELVPEAMEVGYDTPIGLALLLVTLGVTILGIAGAWALSDGLSDAGARPRRLIVTAVVALGTGLALAAYLPLYFGEGASFGFGTAVGWINLGGLVVAFLDIAVWMLVGARLISGAFLRLRPRTAWFLALLSGLCLVAVQLAFPVFTAWLPVPNEVLYAFGLVSSLGWIALALAFLAGLGRGRLRRDAPPRRMRLYVLNPTA